tara:strand:- start:1768 stop:2979 length:1212 start_codon:yes stop_codon:yes gene_type:complete
MVASTITATEQNEDRYSLKKPDGATGLLILADGTLFWGEGIGAEGYAIGEVCFNTSMTGYQEILTDPSYAAQIITFTFPHVGNIGTNQEDIETSKPWARGLILRADITEPSNWRAKQNLTCWLKEHGLIGVSGVDTRKITRLIRSKGAPTGVVCNSPSGQFNLPELTEFVRQWSGLEGLDLASEVTCKETYSWDETIWSKSNGFQKQLKPSSHVVAIDFGVKRNILRSLASVGCKVTVVPADTNAENILQLHPDGIFLSNGPGDPAATGSYAVPVVKHLLGCGLPMFGICLGHQILALALGAKTKKMHLGHRGSNHPVKNLKTGRVEITSQNHGFVVDDANLPANIEISHISLFDGSIEGIRVPNKPIFSVQYHPEASPGPQDSFYLFDTFKKMLLLEGKGIK